MPEITNASRYNNPCQQNYSLRRTRSGYEPSDTESEWQESPWHEGLLTSDGPITPLVPSRTISPLKYSTRPILREDNGSLKVPGARRHSRSPYSRARIGNDGNSSLACENLEKNANPLEVPEHCRHISPYKVNREDSNYGNNEVTNSLRKKSHRTPPRFREYVENGVLSQFQHVPRGSERSNYSRNRSISTPKLRSREKEQPISDFHGISQGPSPIVRQMTHNVQDTEAARDPSPNKIQDMVGSKKLPKSPSHNAYAAMSTDSISPGDIFFSRDCGVPQKSSVYLNGDKTCDPPRKAVSETNIVSHHGNRGIYSPVRTTKTISISTVLSQTNTSSTSAVSRMSSGRTNTSSGSVTNRLSSGRVSDDGSKFSASSGKLGGNFRSFTLNRQKGQIDAWLSCVKGGSCRKSKSPECRTIDEISFIERALVVEEMRLFWADKHRPWTLNGFICHRMQVQQLKQLVSCNNFPHILFKGPQGSGKKSLCKALVQEIFGDSSLKEAKHVQIVAPITSSPHHVEVNLKSQLKNARYTLIALAREIAGNHAEAPEISDPSFRMDFKVIVLFGVDKAMENVQHLIKWIIECYTDACKILLCCEDGTDILDSIKSRCKLVSIDAPGTNEIMDVLIQIAKKENLELPLSFAGSIAAESKQNLREAIMALEACKANNYPFVDGQPIPFGWEEVLMELAADILADPSPKRLFLTRGKLQKLLVESVHPKLILQKLVEQFLKGIEAGIKRELYYWHAYYDKRLPTGPSALLKLEEFVAKFMSLHRKSRT
ncbi:uncharacterized protein [Typha latifolia]|uniref:uncharacterized protein isoform X2 n=1 Tax=Typha latifolia TaxID=4733 RepID=UPI003C2BD0F8